MIYEISFFSPIREPIFLVLKINILTSYNPFWLYDGPSFNKKMMNKLAFEYMYDTSSQV